MIQFIQLRAEEGDPGYVPSYSGPTSFTSAFYPGPAGPDPIREQYRNQGADVSLVRFEDLLLEQMEG